MDLYENSSRLSSIGILIPILATIILFMTVPYVSDLTILFYLVIISIVASIGCSVAGIVYYFKSDKRSKKSLVIGIVGIFIALLLFAIDMIAWVLFVSKWG